MYDSQEHACVFCGVGWLWRGHRFFEAEPFLEEEK